MKQIKILGTGCAKCSTLAQLTEQAAGQMGIDYQIEKVTKISDIMAFGVMITPALVVDGQVKAAGKVPGIEQIKKMLE